MTWREVPTPGLDWGLAPPPLRGLAGFDSCVVQPVASGLLIAVVNGMGHEPDAALAAERMVRAIREARTLDVTPIVRCCDDFFPRERGVVLGLAALDTSANQLTWLGVGNVFGQVLRAHPLEGSRSEVMRTRGGTQGLRLPILHPTSLPIDAGDLLVVATNGFRPTLAHGNGAGETAQALADSILRSRAEPHDGAFVFVGRYLGLREVLE